MEYRLPSCPSAHIVPELSASILVNRMLRVSPSGLKRTNSLPSKRNMPVQLASQTNPSPLRQMSSIVVGGSPSFLP